MQLKHIEFPYSSYLSLHRAPRCRRREESTFGARLGSTTLSHRTLYLRRTERPGSGNDHVEFVCAEQAFGRERGFGGVEKDIAGAAHDEESISTGKDGSVWIERTIPGRRLSRLDH